MCGSWSPVPFSRASLLLLNDDLAAELGMNPAWLSTDEGLRFLLGEQLPASAGPVAQAYSGHQFGQFNPMMGDGRAVLLGEVPADGALHEVRDIHLKGSGRTQFSRGGADGRAAVGPMLREYLVSEAMHAMGIPTTRALAVILTGETVQRTVPEPGAVLVRVASSHLRVGSFQFARMMRERSPELLQRLADFARERHYSAFNEHPVEDGDYAGLLNAVCVAQANLIAQWMHVGFVHGVMNTDNSTISGETIDYGPCAFVDEFNGHTWFSSIDRQGRYAFGRQPAIMLWNLERLAESLLPLIERQLGSDTEGAIAAATEVLQRYPETYRSAFLTKMCAALGFAESSTESEALVDEFVEWLNSEKPDHLSVLRALAGGAVDADVALPTEEWMIRWRALKPDPALMQRTNPVRIPRNHLIEEALTEASRGNFAAFEDLLDAVTDPFDEAATGEAGVEKKKNRTHDEKFARPAPEGFGHYTTYCGT